MGVKEDLRKIVRGDTDQPAWARQLRWEGEVCVPQTERHTPCVPVVWNCKKKNLLNTVREKTQSQKRSWKKENPITLYKKVHRETVRYITAYVGV